MGRRSTKLLSGIGLSVEPNVDGNLFTVSVPTFRHDLEREIDLIEEVARLNGYDLIPVTLPLSRAKSHPLPERQRLVRQTRDHLVSAGFAEVINYSFVSPTLWDRLCLGADDPRRQTVRVLNPLTEEQSVMRTTLVGSLLEAVCRNLAYRSRDLRLFEVRPVFIPRAGENLPEENLHLTAVACGRREPEGWVQGRENVDFYDLKGVAEGLFERLGVSSCSWQGGTGEPFLHPGKSATICCGEVLLGVIGEVHPQALTRFDIDQPVFLLDINLQAVLAVAGNTRSFSPLSRYPDVYRDSAFLLDESTAAKEVLDVIEKAKGRDVEDIVLFDLYRGKGIPEGKKSLAIRVRYRSMDKTLTDEEISRAHGKIVVALERELGAAIR